MKTLLVSTLILSIFLTPSQGQCGCGSHHEEESIEEYHEIQDELPDEEVEQELQEDEDDYGREITLFYSHAHSNSEKFIDAFMNSECKTACSDLGFSEGHKWSELCQSECEDYKAEMEAGGDFHDHYEGGCGCGGGGGDLELENDEILEEDFGTCGQQSDDNFSCSDGVEVVQEEVRIDL
jgi:hypothetical protein